MIRIKDVRWLKSNVKPSVKPEPVKEKPLPVKEIFIHRKLNGKIDSIIAGDLVAKVIRDDKGKFVSISAGKMEADVIRNEAGKITKLEVKND